MFDPSRLFAQLLNTGLQQKDNPLYQVIYNLIKSTSELTNAVSSGSTTIGPVGPQGVQGIPGVGISLDSGMDGSSDPFNELLFNRQIDAQQGILGPVSIGDIKEYGLSGFIITSKDFYGGDWIGWFRRQSNANPCESVIRHQHFSGGAVVPQPIFTGIAARGTLASPTTLQTDDYLLILDGRGYDGSATDWSEYALGFSDTSAQIAFRVGSNWSGSNHESYISFRTIPNGATSPIERLRIASTGFIGHLGYASNPFASFAAASDADYSVVLDSFNAVSVATSANITARRARGSQSSPSATLNGDQIFSFQARGYGSGAFLTHASAAFNFIATENYDSTHGGGEIAIQTTPNASVTAVSIWRFANSGDFQAIASGVKIDLSAISAGNPNFKITATSDTPATTWTGGVPSNNPSGYIEILDGAAVRYIPFWT